MKKHFIWIFALLIIFILISENIYSQSSSAKKIADDHNAMLKEFFFNYLAKEEKLPTRGWDPFTIIEKWNTCFKARMSENKFSKEELVEAGKSPEAFIEKKVKNAELKENLLEAVKLLRSKPASTDLPGTIKILKAKYEAIKDKEAKGVYDVFLATVEGSYNLYISNKWRIDWDKIFHPQPPEPPKTGKLYDIQTIPEMYCDARKSHSRFSNFYGVNMYMLPTWLERLLRIGTTVAGDALGTALGGPFAGGLISGILIAY